MAKRKSEAFKHGEGESHASAKARTKGICQKYINESGHYDKHKSKIFEEYELVLSVELEYFKRGRFDMARVKPYWHPYDLWLELYSVKTKLYKFIVVEIDGKSHESKKQQYNDRKAEYAITACKEIWREFPDAEIKRIPIETAKYGSEEEIINLVFS